MNEQVKEYIAKYPEEIIVLFDRLRQMIFAACEPMETMWAKMPSYYVGEAFVRLIPFKDHINVEASAVTRHQEALTGYKITPKGMLQIYANQDLPREALEQIFAETFAD